MFDPRPTLRGAALTAALLFALANPAAAQGWLEPSHGRPRALPADAGIRSLGTDVLIEVDADGNTARVSVHESFQNVSGRLLEADYLYPLPEGAVFRNLSLFLGEEELLGEMLDGDAAREIYEAIVRRKRDPALVQLFGRGLVRTRVFPVAAGETRKVILRYLAVLDREPGALRLRYPRPVRATDGRAPSTLRIRIPRSSGFGQPYSPTHEVEARRAGDLWEIQTRLDDSSAAAFELILPDAGDRPTLSVVTHHDDRGGTFMLLLSPPATEATPIPRDVTLVLDTSGSMSGNKLEQARAALRQLLAALRPNDRFRLITFAARARALVPELTAATPAAIAEANRRLEDVRADGGTNLDEALRWALDGATAAGRLPVVLALTDGMPTAGETDPRRLADAARELRGDRRVFVFGVGHDVNTYLLDRLAGDGRGSVTYVEPGRDVEGPVARLATRIGAPVLQDLRIASAPVSWYETYPEPLPDLFLGDSVIVVGRYDGSGEGPVIVEGRRGDRPQRIAATVDFPGREAGPEYVSRLWAARKAGALTAALRLDGPDPELIREIHDLALRYGILTEYTAYLVQEPTLPTAEDAEEQVLDRAREMAAAAPAQTGAEAFRRADGSARLQAARSVAAAGEAVGRAAGASERPAGRLEAVGSRVFRSLDGFWTEIEADSRNSTEIALPSFGPAYFRLLRERPGLAPYFALGDRVIIAGVGVLLRIDPDAPEPGAEQVRRVLEAFPSEAR